ncbi:MAG: arylsulfatase A-like enzyme/Flp pilus assembly protein TadD [Chlamydiales bacterium]|jgi:arylsulfatase A-like enzyme/Flp pilus assembly protein TadD
MGAARRVPLRLAVLGLVACSGAGSGPGDGALSVLFISIDTLRADHVGCYGQPLAITPNIDRLAGEGTRFDSCTSSCPLTLPSHATMMTGTYPFVHGARNNGTFTLSDENVTLAELLQEAGFATRAEISAAVLEAEYGLAQGFDQYGEDLAGDALPAREARENHDDLLEAERAAEPVSDAALVFLESRHGVQEPFFLFLHYYDPHQPYRAPEPFAGQFGNGYAAEIAYVDAQVGRVLDHVRSTDLAQRTLIVLTSDHGDGFDEHQETTHGAFLYEATLDVPLVMWAPPRIASRQVVRAQVGLVDLLPTIMDLVGVAAPIDIQGTSLIPLLENPDSDLGLATYSETVEPRTRFEYSELRGLNHGGWKYIHGPRPELYKIATDAAETRDRAQDDGAPFAAMRATLRAIIADAPPLLGRGEENVLTAEDEQRLAALGYASADDLEVEEDPHYWADELSHFEASGVNPMDMTREINHCYTGLGAMRDGNYESGIENWRAYLATNPDYVRGVSYLAQCYAALNRSSEAIPHLRHALALDPERCGDRLRLGAMLADSDQLEEARVQFARTMECDPDLAMAATNLANACILAEDYEAALTTLDVASERFPENARVDLLRAKTLAAMGRPDEAIASLRSALDRRPRELGARLDLATLLVDGGRVDEAQAVYEESLSLLPRNASLRTAAVQFWIDRGDGARALELLDAGLRQQQPTAALAALRLRVLATDDDPQVRDEERARRISERLLKGSHAQDPRVLAAAAAAAAQAGDTERAIDLAQRAASRASERVADALLERIEGELADYRARQTGQDD